MDAADAWLRKHDKHYKRAKPDILDTLPAGKNPARVFCDGPYENLQDGNYLRMAASPGNEGGTRFIHD